LTIKKFRGICLAKKGIAVWIFSSLTFIALAHLIESLGVLISNTQIRLLQLYPFIGEKLQTITPTIYFLGSALATFFLWGITCAIVFENPIEAFLNKILLDAKKQSVVETQLLDQKSELLDVMNENCGGEQQNSSTS
jgi:hypothetical protein